MQCTPHRRFVKSGSRLAALCSACSVRQPSSPRTCHKFTTAENRKCLCLMFEVYIYSRKSSPPT